MSARSERGFTLIEALVAFMIMAGIIALLYRGYASALNISAIVSADEAALMVAQSRLAALGVATPIQIGDSEGQDGAVKWRLSVRPYGHGENNSANARLAAYWVTVTATWDDGRSAEPRNLRLTTIKLRRRQ